MTVHFLRDLEHLKKEILTLGGMVEVLVNDAITALVNRRPELASEVANRDFEIDQKECEVEELCLKVLALHQPVAADLRFVVTVLKVNSDLERIGDYAVHIAERAVFLSKSPALDISLDNIDKMVSLIRVMVKKVLDALVNSNADEAREVVRMDDEVDELHWRFLDKIMDLARSDPASVERAFHYVFVSRHLERIADLTTNIAEDVIYTREGKIVRHQMGGD